MSTHANRLTSFGTRLLVLAPYIWLSLFFLIPVLIVLRISFSESAISQPPYTPVFDAGSGLTGAIEFLRGLTVYNYGMLASDTLYLATYLRSLWIAVTSTAILLLLGFPLAYAMSRLTARWQTVCVMLVILPFWTSFLIRVYAWITILQHDGPLNSVLLFLGIVDAPVAWLASDTAIYIGIVYSYLPFMVLPLYASLQKIDSALLEAAADLGARPARVFLSVVIPLALPGIAAGCLLCFIPIMGEFVIPDLLGGSQNMMIGQVLWVEFFGNKDWPVASAVAIVLLALLLIPIVLFERLRMRLPEDR